MKIFTIKEKVFNTECLFIIGKREETKNYLKKRYNCNMGPDLDDRVEGRSLSWDVEPWNFIWIKETKDKERIINVISHELFHFIINECVSRRMYLGDKNKDGVCDSEPGAYLYGYYAGEVYKKLNNKN